MSLEPIIALLTAYNSRFAHANYAPARQWLAEGAQMQSDILPTLQHWTAKKPDIYAVGFFTPYVREAKEARGKAVAGPISIHERAKRVAFVIRTMGHCYPSDKAWLERYEAKFGRVCGAESTARKNRHGGERSV